MSKVFFLGDSITTGAWDERGGWANRLSGQIMYMTMKAESKDGAFYCLPYNLGVSGNTVADILPRLEQEICARLDPENPDETVELIFSIGVNDSVYMVNEKRPRFTDEEFRQNLGGLIRISQKLADKIHFIGLPPVDDDLLNPIPWASEKAYSCEHVKRFENIIMDVCAEKSIPFLPLFDKWINMPDWKERLINGVHPNTKGHELMSEQISQFLFTDEFVKFHSN